MLEKNYAGFRLELKDPYIALITFDQPDRLNGMTGPMKRDLVEVMLQLQFDESARVVVITGEGRGFCAGDDVGGGYMSDEEWQRAQSAKINRSRTDGLGSYGSLRTLSQAVNRAIRDLDKITIAAINGVAIQSGLSLALACDFRVAARTARLGSATLRFGYLPDEGGHHLLVRHIGVAKTLDFLMRKRIVEAPQALELGLVHEVVEPEELMPHAMKLAEEFARGPQVAMRLLKRAIYSAADLTFDQAGDDIATKDRHLRPSPGHQRGAARVSRKAAAALQRRLNGAPPT